MKISEMSHQHVPIKTKDYALSDCDMLSLLLSFVVPYSEARSVSIRLLHHFSSLHAVFSQSDPMLLTNVGLNQKGIDLLRVVCEIQDFLLRPSLKKDVSIRGVDDVVAYCRHKIAFEPQEMLLVLFLDNNNSVISEDIFYKGTVDSVAIYPRDIFKHAFDKHASSIVLVHNHTSGHTSPSVEDIIFTQDMIKASEILNVAIMDHIIVGPKNYVSLRSMGFIPYKSWGILRERSHDS